MCTKDTLQTISKQILSLYHRFYGASVREVLLYGSYARGDYTSDSDIDYVAIVEGDRETLQEKLKKIWIASSDLNLEYDVVISPSVIPADEYDQYNRSLPYYRNIKQEGQRIG